MQNPQSFYPSSPKKDLEIATITETYTHTDHIQSKFDAVYDEVTTEGVQRHHRLINVEIHQLDERTLNKARSMPQFIQNKDQLKIGSVAGETPMDFKKTDQNINNTVQNGEFYNFSPVPNRVKPTQLNQTMNTNVESREFVGQINTPNQTPKMIQKSTSGYLSQQVFDLQSQELRPSVSVVSQPQVINQDGIPPSNQRISFKTNEYIPQVNNIQNNLPRGSLMAVGSRQSVNYADRPSVYTQQSIIIPAESRNVHKSNATVAETRAQYQSIILDPQGNPLTGHTSRQQKFSFVSDKLPEMNTVQQYQEVEIQRPEYRKIHTNKGEYFRTVGPQEDYFKEEKTFCSRLLPILGVLALLLLVLGTLVGIGVMTGMIGGKNYLMRSETGERVQKNGVGAETRVEEDNKFVSNEVENGKVEAAVNTTPGESVQNGPIVAPPVTPSLPKVQNITQQSHPSQQPTTKPAQPAIKPGELIPSVNQPITQPTKPSTPITFPVSNNQVTYLESTETVTVKPAEKDEVFQPVAVKPIKIVTVYTTTKTNKVESVNPAIGEPAKVQPLQLAPVETLEPVVLEPIKPVNIQPIQPPTVQSAKIRPTIIEQPLTSPSKPSSSTTSPVTQPSSTQPAAPISAQEAQKVITIIIEQNSDRIPFNYKTSIKQDILNQLETVPLNVRDVHHVEILTYQHIEKITGNTDQHKLRKI